MPFEKGKSGNPSGRPAKTKPILEVEYLARCKGPEAIERLSYWLKQDNGPVSVAAAKALLDRGFGTPAQTINATVEDNRSVIRSPEVSEAPEAWQTTHKPH